MTGSKKAGTGVNGSKVVTSKPPRSNNERKGNGETKDDDGEAADDGEKGDEEMPTKKAKVDAGEEKQAVVNGVVGDGDTAGK